MKSQGCRGAGVGLLWVDEPTVDLDERLVVVGDCVVWTVVGRTVGKVSISVGAGAAAEV